MQTHKARLVSSNTARGTIKAPLVRKATEKYLRKSTSLEKIHSPVAGKLKIEYATQHAVNQR